MTSPTSFFSGGKTGGFGGLGKINILSPNEDDVNDQSNLGWNDQDQQNILYLS